MPLQKIGGYNMKWRADFEAIISSVPNGARVLEIGCSDGQLMEILQTEKNAIVRGMEISQMGVNASVARGLSVIQGDADTDLGLFGNDSFDLVVLSNTIQATLKPKNILEELKRIGKRAIISIPNFGYWKVRFDLVFNGRMPVTPELPSTWYNTANFHLCTIIDFCDLAHECGFEILSIIPVNGQKCGKAIKKCNSLINLSASTAVFILERK
jgi:methionine biosynthesis protein MetW